MENIFNDQKKANIKYIVISFLHELGQQLLKLPHEMVDKDIGITGTTYEDITRSYCDGVEHFESILDPYISDEVRKNIKEKDGKLATAKTNLRVLMKVCKTLGYLIPETRTAWADDEDEEYGSKQA